MNPAVIGIGSNSREREGKSEPVVMYSRVKDSIRTTGISRSRAMIIACPSPLDDIADVNTNRRRAISGATLSDSHIRGRRGGKEWKGECEKDQQPEMHLGCELFQRHLRPGG